MLPAPLWVKVSPCLAAEQYAALMRVFAETGVRAVVATNTLSQPTPDGSTVAGVAGGRLRSPALAAVEQLSRARTEGSYPVDIIGGGGILTGAHLRAFQNAGASAAMIYSALVFRGPLAAALILNELEKGNPSHG
ncbi:MAG: hypothetical protein IPK19_01295 [Chloroflexi bacterium]|nr:hypothetical protein [Chloroflexota bacterium]